MASKAIVSCLDNLEATFLFDGIRDCVGGDDKGEIYLLSRLKSKSKVLNTKMEIFGLTVLIHGPFSVTIAT